MEKLFCTSGTVIDAKNWRENGIITKYANKTPLKNVMKVNIITG
jgi:hypothetical protein